MQGILAALPEITDQHAFNLARWREVCADPMLADLPFRIEIRRKRALYFEAGALEVWICGRDGALAFFLADDPGNAAESRLCPDFPHQLQEP